MSTNDQDPTNRDLKVFQIGLTMSGAISAGAYTAGVFDFLIQALDEWEKARGEPGVPPHRVGIKVMSGASAGAITAAVGTVALACENVPKKFASPGSGQEYEYIFDRLYHTWVEAPALVKPDGKDLLASRDINAQAKTTPPGKVLSLLDATLLDEIMKDALSNPKRTRPRPYVSASLHIYMTLSNMRGTPYNVPFEGGTYGMMAHSDRVHYRVDGIGTWQTYSAFADPDQPRMLDINALVGGATRSAEWVTFAQASVASGAFPIGLAARSTAAVRDEYTRFFPQPYYYQKLSAIKPSFPTLLPTQSEGVAFTTIDGGVIDNDPFEYARFTLMDSPPTPNDPDPDKADRAVIMISPFPEPPAFPKEGMPPPDLISIVLALLPALKDQARFKPSELLLAGLPEHASRYLIGPRRVPPQGRQPENPAPGDEKRETFGIACGALGGFGGFLARSFREHDFQLGRRNCQQFLSDAFALPAQNPLFQQAWLTAHGNDPAYLAPTPVAGTQWIRIIPLLGSAAKPVPYPEWPRLNLNDFALLQNRIKNRLAAVVSALLNQNLKGIALWLASAATAWLAKDRVAEATKYYILADLVRRDQIEGWDLPSTWQDQSKVRAVLAELLSPAKALRQTEGLAAETGLSPAAIQDIIERLKGVPDGVPFKVWQAPWVDSETKQPLFALASREPNIFIQWKNRILGAKEVPGINK
jgi:hypothetical protein